MVIPAYCWPGCEGVPALTSGYAVLRYYFGPNLVSDPGMDDHTDLSW